MLPYTLGRLRRSRGRRAPSFPRGPRMKPMKLILAVLLLGITIHTPEARASGTWTLGSNFGLGVISSAGESVTSFGLPSGGGLFLGSVQPGMRIGYVTPSGEQDVYLDAGLNVLS